MIEPITRRALRKAIAAGEVTFVETLRTEHYVDGHLNDLCRNSDLAAVKLTKLGYGNVRRYVGGKQDWIESGLPLERAEVALR